jgi:uncharacterized protein (DUF433 family)
MPIQALLIAESGDQKSVIEDILAHYPQIDPDDIQTSLYCAPVCES